MGKALAVVLAAAGGFVAGVLLAPKSGKETREDIANKKGEYVDKAKAGLKEARKGAGEIKEEIVTGAGEVKYIARDVAERVGEAAKHVRDEVELTANSVKKSAEETTKDVKKSTR